MKTNEAPATNSLRAWVLAARPKTLTGAIAPVLVGGAFALVKTQASIPDYSQLSILNCQFSILLPFLLCLLFAVLMQIDANLINDYFDFKKGTDREDRLGPERACAQGWITPEAMKKGIAVVTTLSALLGLGIFTLHMQWELLVVGALCLVGSFLYTTKLSYLGWGDVLVFVFFGLVPVVFTYYVMTDGGWNIPLIIAGAAMGLATDNLLIVNNYRDRHEDLKSGKWTLMVRIIEDQKKKYDDVHGQKYGEEICIDLYLWFGVLAVILAFISLFLFPYSSIRWPFMLVYLILHFKSFQKLKALDGKALNSVLGATARNIFLFGVLLAISVFL